MKALVIEDDATTRRVLRGLLERTLGCEVVEAEDGVTGLKSIHDSPPDVVLLDVNMPVLGGVEVLRGLRNTHRFVDLPVIAVSAVSERQTVLEMVRLGITDYILKSANVAQTQSRLRAAFAGVRERDYGAAVAQEAAPRGRTLLLIEKDQNFQAFFSSLFEGQFEVKALEDPFDALKMSAENPEHTVVVGDNLDLLPAPSFARVLRDQPQGRGVHLIFVSAGTELSDDEADRFDSVVRKSFVPETFKSAMTRALAGRGGQVALNVMIHGELRRELVAAAQQTIGVLADREATPLAAAHEVSQEIRCLIPFQDAAGQVVVEMALGASEADVGAIAETILGEAVSFDEGGRDAFFEVGNTVAGRLRQSLWDRGVHVEQSQPVVDRTEDFVPSGDALLVGIQLETGERLAIEVSTCGVTPAPPAGEAVPPSGDGGDPITESDFDIFAGGPATNGTAEDSAQPSGEEPVEANDDATPDPAAGSGAQSAQDDSGEAGAQGAGGTVEEGADTETGAIA